MIEEKKMPAMSVNKHQFLIIAAVVLLGLSVFSYSLAPVPQVRAWYGGYGGYGHYGGYGYGHYYSPYSYYYGYSYPYYNYYYGYPYYGYGYNYGYNPYYGTGCQQTGTTSSGGATNGCAGNTGQFGQGTNTITIATNLPQGVASGAGSYQYSPGSTLQLKASPTIDGGNGIRYMFDHWSGDYSGTSPAGSVKVDGDKVITANYKTQYFITMSASPGGVIDMSKEQGWYDAGADMTMNAPNTVSAGEGVRYVFDSAMIDGVKETTPAMTIHVDKPHTVDINYVKQYYLKLNSDEASVSGEGWYNEGSQATLEAPASVPAGFGTSYKFTGWSGAVKSGSAVATVLMDGPKTVTANWQIDRTGLYIAIAGILGLAVVAGLALKRRNAPAHGFTSSAGTICPNCKTSAASTCPSCKAALPAYSRFCPECGGAQN